MDPATYLEPRGPWSALLASLTSRPLQRKVRLRTSTEGPTGRGHLMMRIHLMSRLDTEGQRECLVSLASPDSQLTVHHWASLRGPFPQVTWNDCAGTYGRPRGSGSTCLPIFARKTLEGRDR